MLQDVRIPMLDSFKFYQYEQIDTTRLRRFLSTHSRTLKTLDLQFHSYNSDFPHENWFIIRVTLPKLQSLAVKFWSSSDYHLQGALDYVVQYRHALISLDVTLAPYSYDQIYGLATQFSTKGRLRKLGLTAKTLIPQLLILLCSKLPFLEDLTLEFYGLAAREGQVRGNYAEEAEVSFCCHSVQGSPGISEITRGRFFFLSHPGHPPPPSPGPKTDMSGIFREKHIRIRYLFQEKHVWIWYLLQEHYVFVYALHHITTKHTC